MKKRIYIILLLLPLASCNDMFKNFLNEEPETLVTNTNFWKTEKDVEAAVYELHVSSDLGVDTLKHDFTGTGASRLIISV